MKKLTISFVLFFMYSNNSFAGIENEVWEKYLNKSCETTISGKLQRSLKGERSFWVEVHVSMDQWAQNMRLDKPEEYCAAGYTAPDQLEKRVKCYTGVKEYWDWYARCRPLVVHLCKKAGGYCN
jgi:hypothetical protein